MNYEALEKLANLRDKGILSEEEFQKEKEKILNPNIIKTITKDTSRISQERFAEHIQPFHRTNTNPSYQYHNNKYQQSQIQHNTFWSFSTFFSWNGRISRSYFWGVLGVYLGIAICMIMAMDILEVERGSQQAALFGLCFIIVVICAYWSHMVTSIKRFHDMNQTGWLIFVPLYNFIGPAFIEGTRDPNKYGPDSVER